MEVGFESELETGQAELQSLTFPPMELVDFAFVLLFKIFLLKNGLVGDNFACVSLNTPHPPLPPYHPPPPSILFSWLM